MIIQTIQSVQSWSVIGAWLVKLVSFAWKRRPRPVDIDGGRTGVNLFASYRAYYQQREMWQMINDIHAYTRDPQSGAGNCRCGRAEHERIHPHEARPARYDIERCVCGLPCGQHPDWRGR